MGEVTRDEIRRACEAVGWRWLDPRVTPGGDDYSSAWDGKMDRFMILPRGADQERYDNADAFALLEATGEDLQIIRLQGEHGNDWWRVRVRVSLTGPSPLGEGPTLPAAALRAVLAWAEGKGAKG